MRGGGVGVKRVERGLALCVGVARRGRVGAGAKGLGREGARVVGKDGGERLGGWVAV